ncbi:MAG TPA: hypothetical protein VFD00_08990, partial [Thermoclostridium sp.]|nr:hypothetical protein [Thermoclostridium sp.]
MIVNLTSLSYCKGIYSFTEHFSLNKLNINRFNMRKSYCNNYFLMELIGITIGHFNGLLNHISTV